MKLKCYVVFNIDYDGQKYIDKIFLSRPAAYSFCHEDYIEEHFIECLNFQ